MVYKAIGIEFPETLSELKGQSVKALKDAAIGLPIVGLLYNIFNDEKIGRQDNPTWNRKIHRAYTCGSLVLAVGLNCLYGDIRQSEIELKGKSYHPLMAQLQDKRSEAEFKRIFGPTYQSAQGNLKSLDEIKFLENRK